MIITLSHLHNISHTIQYFGTLIYTSRLQDKFGLRFEQCNNFEKLCVGKACSNKKVYHTISRVGHSDKKAKQSYKKFISLAEYTLYKMVQKLGSMHNI